MYEKSKTCITFTYKHEGYTDECYSFPDTSIEYSIDGESNLTEVCGAFENFLLSCGYRFNPNETIGIIEV